MAKKNLNFDAGQLKDFITIYEENGGGDDGYGGSLHIVLTQVLKTRCKKNIKTKTSQSQVQGGSFDFYQVYEFIIRARNGFGIKKDMIAESGGERYVIRGFVPMENNPEYTTIITEIKL